MLPLPHNKRPYARKKGTSTMPDDIEATQEKLLIVDDKAANLDLLRKMLTPLGHQIFFATSGAKALEVATSAQPDLVLLDVMMPEMDGFETCRRFKQNEALAKIPIIFVTARTWPGDSTPVPLTTSPNRSNSPRYTRVWRHTCASRGSSPSNVSTSQR
jgi:CheY-like chemotaxis protein